MKIAIIGGAGVRVPLLVGGLSRSDLRIAEIALYDIDQRSPARHRRPRRADGQRRDDHERVNA